MASRLLRLLDRLEAAGNRLPTPAWLFVWLCGLVLLLSWLAALAGWQASYPDGSRTVTAVNLLSAAGLTKILTDTVSNFTGFAPVGPVIVAMLGLQLGYLVGGSVLVETVFSWPGTGFLLNKAILARDLPLLQGTILVLAVAFVLLNLIVDLAQSAIDPRIKRA